MLDSKHRGVTMTSTHKISFSIVDILDPNKFTSKKASECAKFGVADIESTSLETQSDAEGGDTAEGKEEEEICQKIFWIIAQQIVEILHVVAFSCEDGCTVFVNEK